ncbi:hypothetical protein H5410_041365 [Solanum commersonii]|uniref:ER membrane protein complex subunit 7 beta-sandwich domain-containing protein n=1 Tax=Solanum commersonii TaxID=4109 RepID=A0A9J5XRD5_SOLCO|nr:hypothetical protein H5410_041365 [Solanum commersonii]
MAVMHRSMAILLTLIQLVALCSLLPSSLAFASGFGRSTDGYTINGRVKIPGFSLKGSGLAAKASNVRVILNSGQRVAFLRPDGYFSLREGMKEDEFAGEMVETNEGVLASRNSARLGKWGTDKRASSANVARKKGDLRREVSLKQKKIYAKSMSGLFCSLGISLTLVFQSHNVPAGTHLIEVSAIGYFFSPVRVDVSARNPGKVQAALTETRRSLSELVLEPLRDEQYYEMREPFSVMSLVKSPMGLMVGFMVVVMFLMPKLVENMDPEEIRKAQEEMRSQGVPSLSSLLPGAQRSN